MNPMDLSNSRTNDWLAPHLFAAPCTAVSAALRRLVLLCSLWAALLALAAADGAVASNRAALVIGNASYEVGRLSNPVNDATDMASALRAMGFDVTLATNLNRDGLLEQVEAFRGKIRPGGIALVFFAGHAVEQGGENWLLPVKNGAIRTQAHVRIHSVSAQDVLSAIEERGARLNILVLDACRDNPLPAGARSAQRGLAAIATGTSSLVAFATSPGRTAADGQGRNSPYTAAFLNGLRDPTLSVTDLFEKVGAEVVQTTGGAQVPWKSNTPIWPAVYLAGEAPQRNEGEVARMKEETKPAKFDNSPGPRFENAGNGLLKDKLTGLFWTERDSSRELNWQQATAWCKSKGMRLPTIQEIRNVHDSADLSATPCGRWRCRMPSGFTLNSIWSWTSDAPGPSTAWLFNYRDGGAVSDALRHFERGALCVSSK